ncbi:MAG: hypothetical protein QM690_20180, partial [Sphingobium sp.]
LLVAAREANGAPCYPGSLPDVLGVAVDWDMARDRYRLEGGGQLRAVAASGYPRPIPGVQPRRNLHGISFAVAQVSGFAALASEGMAGEGLAGEGLGSAPDRADALWQALMREVGPLPSS